MRSPLKTAPRVPVPAVVVTTVLATGLLLAGCSDGGAGSGDDVPSPVSTAPSVSVSSAVSAEPSAKAPLIPFYTVVTRDGLSDATLNKALTTLAALPGVTGTSKTPGRLTVDVTAAITDAQRDAVVRQLAALGEVAGVVPSRTAPPR